MPDSFAFPHVLGATYAVARAAGASTTTCSPPTTSP